MLYTHTSSEEKLKYSILNISQINRTDLVLEMSYSVSFLKEKFMFEIPNQFLFFDTNNNFLLYLRKILIVKGYYNYESEDNIVVPEKLIYTLNFIIFGIAGIFGVCLFFMQGFYIFLACWHYFQIIQLFLYFKVNFPPVCINYIKTYT